MAYAHFLVPLEGGEAEQRLNRFLAQHAVLKIEDRFVEEGGKGYWAYRIRYEAGGAGTPGPAGRPAGVDYVEKLGPEDGALYIQLKDWRKRRAEEEGSVPFALFTNAMLAAIAEQRPGSLDALRKIKGVGDGRVEKYGEEVLRMVTEAPSSAKPEDPSAGS